LDGEKALPDAESFYLAEAGEAAATAGQAAPQFPPHGVLGASDADAATEADSDAGAALLPA
jgi:hypothetical protein